MRGGQATVDYQARFDQLQTRFIDEPREAVREASTLVREAVDRLFNGNEDTEQLRRVMQGYRDLLARIDGREINGGGMARDRGTAAEVNGGRGRTETMEPRSPTRTDVPEDQAPEDRAPETETS